MFITCKEEASDTDPAAVCLRGSKSVCNSLSLMHLRKHPVCTIDGLNAALRLFQAWWEALLKAQD